MSNVDLISTFIPLISKATIRKQFPSQKASDLDSSSPTSWDMNCENTFPHTGNLSSTGPVQRVHCMYNKTEQMTIWISKVGG